MDWRNPWAVIDIETTGLDPTRHEVCEIGVVYGQGQDWHPQAGTFGASLEYDEEAADPRAMEINQVPARRIALQAPPVVHWRPLLDTLDSILKDRLIVASPAHFDVGFLTALWHKHERKPPWGHRAVIDLKSYAAGKWGLTTDLGNGEIARLLNVPENEDEHTALADAIWTAQIWTRLIA